MGGVSGGAAARVRARGRCCSACTLPVSAPPPRSPPWCRESRSPHQRQATLRGYGRQCGGCRRALCSAIVRQCAADHARAPCSPPPPRATYVELWVEDVNALKEVRKGQVSRRALVDARCTHESAGAPSRRPPPPLSHLYHAVQVRHGEGLVRLVLPHHLLVPRNLLRGGVCQGGWG